MGYDLVIEEKSLVTGTVDHQSNGLCNTSIRNSQIFLLCFAVDSEKSFENAIKMCRHITREKMGTDDQHFAVTFVATHCELQEQRVICAIDGLLSRSAMMKKVEANDASYVETSFVRRQNVDCAIDLFARGQGSEVEVAYDEDLPVYPDLPPSPARVQHTDIDANEWKNECVYADALEAHVIESDVVHQVAEPSDGDVHVHRDSAIRMLHAIGQRINALEIEVDDRDDGGARSEVGDRTGSPRVADVSRPLDAPLSNAEHDELDNLMRGLQQQNAEQR